MKQEKSQRRVTVNTRRRSSASSILSGGSAANSPDYLSFGWILLFVTFLTIVLVSFLFTPFTHQLDEIKNVLLMFCPPVLLIAALWKMDFSAITWKRHGALILLGLYFAWMWVSWLFNPYKLVGERVIWFNVGVSTFTVIFAWYMNTENKIRKTMIFFVILGLVSTFLGLFLYAGRYTAGFYQDMLSSPYWQTADRRPWATLVYTLTSSSSDMYSFILNSDFYAAFLVMLIPISLSMFFVEQRVIYKIVALVGFLLMNVCLILTNSNDSFIAMFLVAYPIYFILGAIYVKQWGLSKRFITTFGLCSLALVILIAILMLPKLSATFNFKTAAFEGRRVLWGGGFWPWVYGDNYNAQHADFISVIFGTGPGGYRHYFPWFRRPDFFDQQINNVTTFSHDFYLDVLLETGIVGLILFVGFHVRVVADGFKQIRTTESRTHLYYQLAVLTGLAGIAVQNYSSPNNRWAVAGMCYWCLFGLSMGLVNVENPGAPGDSADKKIAGFPVYKMAWGASMCLAALFFLRCVFPGGQFYDYWISATENAEGLRDMEGATYKGLTTEQQFSQLAASVTHFEEAIKRNPTFATSYYKLGHVYNQIGQYTNDPTYSDMAIKTYEDLDKINANYSEVHLNLGIMYAQKAGNLPMIEKDLIEDMTDLQQQMQAATGAKREELEADYDEKSEKLKALQANEEKIRLESLETSYDHMKKASHQSLKPNTQYLTGSIGRELAMTYEKMGQQEKADKIKEQAKKYFRSLINYKPKLEALQEDQKDYYEKAKRSLLTLADETNNMDESIEILKLMIHDSPENDLLVQALMEAYDRAGKTADKLAYLEESVHSDPTDANLRLNLAEAYKQAGEQKKYINELRRAEVLETSNTKLLAEIYQAYAAAKNTEMEKSYAEKLAKAGINPSDLNSTSSAQPGNTTGSSKLTTIKSHQEPTVGKVIRYPVTSDTSSAGTTSSTLVSTASAAVTTSETEPTNPAPVEVPTTATK